MCTAMTFRSGDFYFGRNLDYELSFGEEVVVTPRNYPFSFRCGESLRRHYALIGMARVEQGYPLYFDAVNEKGLCMAGLNFVGNARFAEESMEKRNLQQFELILWVLGQCATVKQAEILLRGSNLVAGNFSSELPAGQLHYMIAHREGCIVVEPGKEGLKIYENPVEVLTNNPPFPMQLNSLNDYPYLSPYDPEPRFPPQWQKYSRGMGSLGLPGDLSSRSRFIRAAFVRQFGCSGREEEESVIQMFHMLYDVAQTRGLCRLGGGDCEITQYTSCCNADRGAYYYTTYNNMDIHGVELCREELEGARIIRYPLVRKQEIKYSN